MPIGLTHFGEAIVQTLIERQPNRFLELCGLPASGVFGGRAFREARLLPNDKKRFDGASLIDLIVPLNTHEALPVEVKLGATRLSKQRVETEWLYSCRPSHKDTAWAGNMMSILDQLIPSNRPNERLVAHVDGTDYPLTQSWCVVVRRRTAVSWTGEGRPSLARATIVSFDDLVEGFMPDEFDEIVRNIITFPYYNTWIKNG